MDETSADGGSVAERVGRRLPSGSLAARAKQVPGAVWLVLLIAGAVIAAGVTYAVAGHSTNPVTANIVGGFRSDDPRAFTFSYTVTKNPLATSECAIEVQDASHEKVGAVVDTVGPTPNNARTTTKQLVVPTRDQGVTAIIDSCHLLHR